MPLLLILFAMVIVAVIVLYLPMMPPPSTASAQQPSYNINLTGTWKADDGGTYYIRNIGNVVWWLGISGENDGKTFSNVLKGYIHENNGTISADWADIPRGANKYYGTLTLSIDSNTTLQKVSETSYDVNGNPSCCFGASEWER